MFVLSEPQYPRAPAEKAFLGLYGIAVLINFAALVITLASYKYRLDQTYSSFSGSTATVSDDLTALLQGCGSYTDTSFSLGGMAATATVDESSAPFLFLSNSLAIVGVIVIMFFIFLNDVFAKGCFGANIRNWRIRGVTIPVNTIAANAMLVQSIGILVLIGTTHGSRSFLNKYVQHCATRFSTANRTAFLARENDVQNVFGTDLGLIVVAVSINLGFYFLAFVALCVEAFSDAAAEFERRKYYWEENNLGVPNNKELFHYSKWRKFAIEQIGKGASIELAPVSYLEWMRDLEEAKRRWAADPKGFWKQFGRTASGDNADNSDDDDDDDGDDAEAFAGGDLHHHNHHQHNSAGDQFQQQSYGAAGAVPIQPGEAPPPIFNHFRLGGGADEPEELVMPEGFDDEGDFFEDLDAFAAARQHHFAAASAPGGEQFVPDDYYSRRAGSGGDGGAGAAANLSPSAQRDKPFERRPSQTRRNNNGAAAAPETEEQRRERHRLRRLNETAEERAMRKDRKRNGGAAPPPGARSGSARGGGPIPAPMPSP